MKKPYIIITLLIISNAMFAQVGINADNSAPNPSAMLDVKSTTKGFLPPRMTTAVRDLISSPVEGLTIYNTTKNCNETYNGSTWVGNAHFIGENYGGGIVFYVYDNGQHGLIAATADQSTGVRWIAGTYTNTMAYADGIGSGKSNTSIIISNQGYGDGATYAARECNEYSKTVGGSTYGDWYLPSKYELNLLWMQKSIVGGFADHFYWSSTEITSSTSWFQFFVSGAQGAANKIAANNYYVRAIRAF